MLCYFRTGHPIIDYVSEKATLILYCVPSGRIEGRWGPAGDLHQRRGRAQRCSGGTQNNQVN